MVRTICDHAALLERGQLVESGALRTLLANPDSRVRQALLPDPEILRRFMARHGVTEEVRLCRVA
ncbi:hypothetical protein ACB295_07015 [Aeromonas caviae]|uniref:hypothetical protein n=1 Tax=Aeromonas caviae TaxID=648 RepID=UPI0027DA1AE8|nr:hypothetical protein [Aeromonas caviae]MDX7753463.1 hypothetical protein [Aeromonas caviae]MDX7773698.1 hypothetical protein [Aeromonas caviae]